MGNHLIKLIYANNLDALVFQMTLNDGVLVSTFSSLMFEYILNNLDNETERWCILNLVDKIQLNVKQNHNEDTNNEYFIKTIQA